MIRFTSLVKAVLVTACLAFQHSLAHAEPAENKILKMNRTAASGNLINGSLSKNLYTTETYDAPYTVEIPYEVEETYIESVPYSVEVPYTEYVTDYRQEYVCNDVTRYREECHTEQKCYLIPGERECRDVEECGVNVHGQTVCKTRQVCETGPSSQRCDDHRVCRSEPYTDRECGYESVAYQREVSGYRTETRYREETRTRTVTRYRSEERCCRPETRLVFDKQLQFQVSVHFPQNATLLPNEAEQLNLTLVSADQKSAQVSLQAVNTVFGYAIAKQSVSGATLNVELALVPKFDLNNAGVKSIQNLLLQFVKPPKKFQLSFNDAIVSSRVATSYKVTITDEAGNKLEEQLLPGTANGAVTTILNNITDKKAKIKATIQVSRSGALIGASPLVFDVSVLATKKD